MGREHVVSFLDNCFRGQEYRLTALGTPEHDMWDFVDEDEQAHDGDTGVRFN